MTSKLFVLILLCIYAVSLNANAAENKFILKVSTFNIQGAPFPFSFSKTKRFKKIGKDLKIARKQGTSPHVLLFQEAFTKKRNIINSIANYPFQYLGPNKTQIIPHKNRKRESFLNSGLMAISEFEALDISEFKFGYQNCEGVDCYSNKGLQAFTLEIPNAPFKVRIINVQLQNRTKYEQMRLSQIDLMNRFIEENSNKEDIVILVGDFNFGPKRDSYEYFRQIFPNFNLSGEVCLNPKNWCKIKEGTDLKSIFSGSSDHLFYKSSNKIFKIKPVWLEKNMKKVSDHNNFQVHYELSW